MPQPVSTDELLDLVRRSGVLEDKRLDAHLEKLREANALPAEPAKLAAALVRDGLLTNFQCEQLLQGKWRRFHIGKYKVLERLGSGGMGSVFLCEHKFMRRRVAVKVLPTAKALDPSSLERFYREARAVAAVDHPNIVHAYDIDQDENLHFLVMEYVDGASLQDILRRSGPISLERACHYVSQACQALEHANRAGLVHRDIKPGNVLVDRAGCVKVLDMGLARFFNDEEDMLTRKYDENVLGTADYLAPEQADDSHTVDIRADIYSLGGTFYFLLTGKTPFGDGSVPQKLMWHRTRQPKPLSAYRNDVPAEVQSILDKMMAKEPSERYQNPADIVAALAPWTGSAIAPPSEAEMPQLSPAVSGISGAGSPTTVSGSGPASGSTKKTWQVTGAPVSNPPSSSAKQTAPPSPPAPKPVAAVPAIGPPGPTLRLKTSQVPLKTGANTSGTSSAVKPAAARAAGKKPDDSAAVDVAADTADPSAKGNTPPQSPSKSKTTIKRPVPVPAKKRFQLNWMYVLAGVAAVVLGAVILLALAYILGFGRGTGKHAVLKVGARETFATVGSALQRAHPGDHIVLVDPDHREQLDYQNKGNLSDVTIEAADHVHVVWRAPKAADGDNALLHLVEARDFHIKGIHFRGDEKTQQLIYLVGLSPGLTLENLTLEGFTRYGILIANCAGTADKPVRLMGLKATASDAPQAAVYFTAAPNAQPRYNGHVRIDACKFDGTYKTSPVHFDGLRPASVLIGP
jgi:serine/threonine protein kinase